MEALSNVAYVACRSCGSSRLTTIADYGNVPLASSLVSAAQNSDETFKEQLHPLHCVVCEDCTLMQLDFDVNSHDIFVDSYHYRASYSDAILEHAKQLSQDLVSRYSLNQQDVVLEIGSNDGYFLRWINDGRVRAIGIEPSPGPAQDSKKLGIDTIEEFFDDQYADRYLSGSPRARLVYMSNVLSHVRNTASVLDGIEKVLAEDGTLVIENPWVKDLVDENQFDMIYHEHACYFSCHSLEKMLNRVNLYLNDAQYVSDLHGGMLIWHASRTPGRTEELARYFDQEVREGINTVGYYKAFGERISLAKQRIAGVVEDVLATGGTMAAYGAVAKGVTLLQALGLTSEQIAFTVDRNEEKVGNYLPGSRINVEHVERLGVLQPDVVLLLAWNYKKEIAEQQSEYISRGGTFLIPVPEVEFIGTNSYVAVGTTTS